MAHVHLRGAFVVGRDAVKSWSTTGANCTCPKREKCLSLRGDCLRERWSKGLTSNRDQDHLSILERCLS